MRFGRRKKTEELKAPAYLRFNLLPDDYLKRRRRAALKALRVVALIVIMAAVVGLTAHQLILLRGHEAAEQTALDEIVQYEESLQIEQELLSVRSEYDQRQELVMGTALPVDVHTVLEDVAASVPSAVTLDSLYVQHQEGVIITGVADSLHRVSHFSSVLRDDIEYLPEPAVTFPVRIQPEGTPDRVGFRMTIPWDLGGDQ